MKLSIPLLFAGALCLLGGCTAIKTYNQYQNGLSLTADYPGSVSFSGWQDAGHPASFNKVSWQAPRFGAALCPFQVRSASRVLMPAQFASSAAMLALGGQVQNAYVPHMDVVLNADTRPPIQQLRGPLTTEPTVTLSYMGSRLVRVTVMTDSTGNTAIIFTGKIALTGKTVPLPLAKAALFAALGPPVKYSTAQVIPG